MNTNILTSVFQTLLIDPENESAWEKLLDFLSDTLTKNAVSLYGTPKAIGLNFESFNHDARHELLQDYLENCFFSSKNASKLKWIQLYEMAKGNCDHWEAILRNNIKWFVKNQWQKHNRRTDNLRARIEYILNHEDEFFLTKTNHCGLRAASSEHSLGTRKELDDALCGIDIQSLPPYRRESGPGKPHLHALFLLLFEKTGKRFVKNDLVHSIASFYHLTPPQMIPLDSYHPPSSKQNIAPQFPSQSSYDSDECGVDLNRVREAARALFELMNAKEKKNFLTLNASPEKQSSCLNDLRKKIYNGIPENFTYDEKIYTLNQLKALIVSDKES